MKMTDDLKRDLDRMMKAETVLYQDGDMVFHPLLQHLPSNGFCSDPQECAEMLRDHCPDAIARHRGYAFSATPEGCQSLDVDNLIESAAQDMYEDWYERVTDECKHEIAIAQSALDALQKRFQDFPTWRADLDRVVLLPVLPVEKTQRGERKKR